MTNAQTIINSILTGYARQYDLSPGANDVLERVRERLTSSPDARRDAEVLYGANDCDDLALSLLWVLERADQDTYRSEPTSQEEQAVFASLTSSLTRMGLLHQADPEGASGIDGSFPQSADAEEGIDEVAVEGRPEGVGESIDTVSEEYVADAAAGEQMGGGESASVPAVEGSTDTEDIGRLLEQLVEALQAGSDDRDQYLVSLRASFAACLADATTDAAVRQYAETVDGFLAYVQDNDLLDDVRVMNFFTNVQEPFAQWLAAPEGGREGILEQAIDFLADFRTMFE